MLDQLQEKHLQGLKNTKEVLRTLNLKLILVEARVSGLLAVSFQRTQEKQRLL